MSCVSVFWDDIRSSCINALSPNPQKRLFSTTWKLLLLLHSSSANLTCNKYRQMWASADIACRLHVLHYSNVVRASFGPLFHIWRLSHHVFRPLLTNSSKHAETKIISTTMTPLWTQKASLKKGWQLGQKTMPKKLRRCWHFIIKLTWQFQILLPPYHKN